LTPNHRDGWPGGWPPLGATPSTLSTRRTRTGNISNRDLEALMVPLIPDIVREFQTHAFLEIGRAGIVIRG
jgi:hypothetical protein